MSILHSMVAMQADRDAAGELLTPTPRVKRILATQRCLPHIAQVRERHLAARWQGLDLTFSPARLC